MPEPTAEYYDSAVKAWKERDELQEKLNELIATYGDLFAKLDAEIIRLKAQNSKLRKSINALKLENQTLRYNYSMYSGVRKPFMMDAKPTRQ